MRTILFVLVLAACSDDGGAPPAAPTNLGVSNVGGGAHLVWTDNSDNEDEFVVLRKTATTSYAEVGTVPFDTSQFHDAVVVAGTAYTYVIAARNDAGEASSNEAAFTP